MKPLHCALPSLSEYVARLREFGNTDEAYLAVHYPRFVGTLAELQTTWPPDRGRRVLDVGAHWLHLSTLLAMRGYDVTALDMPVTLRDPNVIALANANRIALLECNDLEHPTALDELPESSVNVIMFTEIIEHITFNPVDMWRRIHRVAAPGARIVVTTPNFYALRERLARFRRRLFRSGGGVAVKDILQRPTHAHHWKEYALVELQQYFRLLSHDFRMVKAKYVYWTPGETSPKRTLLALLYRLLPPLRPDLYVEIEVVGKSSGIQLDPSW